MKIVSYNIMFNDVYKKERTEGLIILLKEINADIICLQEVTEETLKILKESLVNYKLVEFNDTRIYKEIIFYKNLTLIYQHMVGLPSTMGRALSFAIFENFRKTRFQVVTFHLESLEFSRLRNTQMKKLVSLIENCEIPVIACGDSNLKKGEPGVSEFSKKFIDLGIYYKDLSPTSHGDRFFNNFLKERYDRVWSKGCKHYRFELVGNLKIPGKNYWISDHDGILFGVSLEPR